jgi:hypothetical protein
MSFTVKTPGLTLTSKEMAEAATIIAAAIGRAGKDCKGCALIVGGAAVTCFVAYGAISVVKVYMKEKGKDKDRAHEKDKQDKENVVVLVKLKVENPEVDLGALIEVVQNTLRDNYEK